MKKTTQRLVYINTADIQLFPDLHSHGANHALNLINRLVNNVATAPYWMEKEVYTDQRENIYGNLSNKILLF